MFRQSQGTNEARQGVILLVVISMLTLFAIVGLSFVLYAESAAKTALLCREGEQQTSKTSLTPENLLQLFVGQLLFDNDDTTGIYSGLRGHSLARSMYGYNDGDPLANTVPYNGTGRLHDNTNPIGPVNADDYVLLNYTYFPSDGFLRDPERMGQTPSAQPNKPNWRRTPQDVRASFTGGFNVPYTYPDLNNFFLAAVKADGTVLVPSFHRPWVFGSLDPNAKPANQNWINAVGKYLTPRPREIDQRLQPGKRSAFPNAETATGDVKNLVGAPGGNDSIWIDINAPVMVGPDGKKFKPLFAPLIIDLDNRVNVNVHGNIKGLNPTPPPPPPAQQYPTHASNQGWGSSEVSLKYALNVDALNDNPGAGLSIAQREWVNLFLGTPVPPPPWPPMSQPPPYPAPQSLWYNPNPPSPPGFAQLGRYGGLPWNQPPSPVIRGTPGATGAALNGRFVPRAHFYSQFDYDAVQTSGAASGALILAGPPPALNAWGWFPGMLPGFDNGTGGPPPAPDELTGHPQLYNFFHPEKCDDQVFSLSNMEALLRYGDTGSASLPSTLFQMCPLNFTTDSIFDPATGLPPTAGIQATWAAARDRRRRLVTTHSFDLIRPGLSPWLWDRAATPVTYAPGTLDTEVPPVGALANFPPMSNRAAGVPASSDFRQPGAPAGSAQIDWRGIDAAIGRIDLNGFLPPYPHMGSGTDPASYTAAPLGGTRFDDGGPLQGQYFAAEKARQKLANDIYRRLLRVTGVPPAASPGAPTDTELMPRRWLAQLAANMVDYIDEDDINTAYNFYDTTDGPGIVATDTSAGNPELLKYWVFGTELPRVVLSEALAEYQPPPSGMMPPGTVAGPVAVRFYAELANPFPAGIPATFPHDTPAVQLYVNSGMGTGPAYSPFRVVIAATGTSPDGLLRRPAGGGSFYNDNVLGTPESPPLNSTTDSDFSGMAATVGAPGTPSVPMSITPNSYFLVAPPDPPGPFTIDLTGTITGPAPTPLVQTSQMETLPGEQYVPPMMTSPTTTPNGTTSTGFTILLRRLANPYMPYNATTNPYLTIDYMEKLAPYSSLTSYTSRGKRQPYAGYLTLPAAGSRDPYAAPAGTDSVANQTVGAPPMVGPQQTFGSPNNPPATPQNWLVHLDRQLVSPMELLQVSGYKPHLLTHKFVSPDTSGAMQLFNHRVPWLTQTNRLFRIFEFLEPRNQAAGVAFQGRAPGKININTIWDPETLLALADPQLSNSFTVADLYKPLHVGPGPVLPTEDDPTTPQTVFWRMMQSRTPGLLTGAALSAADAPFMNLGTGVYPAGDPQFPGKGIDSTLLRVHPLGSGQRVFDPFNPAPVSPTDPKNHPYVKNELLTKLFNNVTTRSNVFAVWVTVGFFEVTDDAARPVKIGAEIGKAQNKNVRHRMFAIVDRTNLSLNANSVTITTANIAPAGGPQLVPIGASSGLTAGPPNTGVPWSIEVGSRVIVDTGASQETVTVLAVDSALGQRPNIVAVFGQLHNAGAQIIAPNNIGPPPIFLNTPSGVAAPATPPAMVPATLQLPDATGDNSVPGNPRIVGVYDGVPWSLQTGDWLIVDVGPNQRTVQVTGVNAAAATPTFTANFNFQTGDPSLNGPMTITFPNTTLGNPGPQPRFEMRNYPWIVRHISIIQ